MKHLAAYALCVLGGKEEPAAADVEKVLKEAGAKVDADVLAKLVEELKGKQLHEVSPSAPYLLDHGFWKRKDHRCRRPRSRRPRWRSC